MKLFMRNILFESWKWNVFTKCLYKIFITNIYAYAVWTYCNLSTGQSHAIVYDHTPILHLKMEEETFILLSSLLMMTGVLWVHY